MLVDTRSQGPGPTGQGQGHAEGDTGVVTEVTATPLTAHSTPGESEALPGVQAKGVQQPGWGSGPA